MSLATIPTPAVLSAPADTPDLPLQLARGSAFAALLDAAEITDPALHDLLVCAELCAQRQARGESLAPWVELIQADGRCAS